MLPTELRITPVVLHHNRQFHDSGNFNFLGNLIFKFSLFNKNKKVFRKFLFVAFSTRHTMEISVFDNPAGSKGRVLGALQLCVRLCGARLHSTASPFLGGLFNHLLAKHYPFLLVIHPKVATMRAAI